MSKKRRVYKASKRALAKAQRIHDLNKGRIEAGETFAATPTGRQRKHTDGGRFS